VIKQAWRKLQGVEGGSPAGLAIFIVAAMSVATIIAIPMGVLPIALLGWFIFGLTALLRATVIEKAGNALIPKGASTPSVAQHSNIEAMVMRGKPREAADAYRAAIEADPAEMVACEKLGQLALRELKDYDLALWAYREAERRAAEPKRRVGYALLVAGILRDNVGDEGRTMVELRRIVERYPDAPNAAQLRQELNELKARRFEAT